MLAIATLVIAQLTSAPAFAGVTLGETEQALVAQMGEPLLRRPLDSGASEYAYFGAGSTLVFVRIERGNAVAVAVKPVPWKDVLGGSPPAALGITIGDPPLKLLSLDKARFVDAVKNDDGVTAFYRGDDGAQYGFTSIAGQSGIAQILARLDPARAQKLAANPAPAPALHGGATLADAIIVKAPSEAVGVKFEYAFLAAHPCSGGQWRTSNQSLQSSGRSRYDVLSVKCNAGNAQRDFYFDITDYFGKM